LIFLWREGILSKVTVFDAEIEMYKWFNENHAFEIERDFHGVVMITDNLEDDKAAILAALKEFQDNGLIDCQVRGDKSYWVLKKTFDALPQTVTINSYTAASIANVVNSLCDAIGESTEKCDPKCITEKDLLNLVTVSTLSFTKEEQDE
jgi:hypothetical protein